MRTLNPQSQVVSWLWVLSFVSSCGLRIRHGMPGKCDAAYVVFLRKPLWGRGLRRLAVVRVRALSKRGTRTQTSGVLASRDLWMAVRPLSRFLMPAI